ncbi:TonB-dependent receptor domain-containing protein [Hymenobacter psychrotolerans]|uniref:Outer membrane receptor for ferrienterochelin and colicins n=1 Tax=Hymenobacter psychrotolerans DSM 18569 TaxID=1121959 RepID=A0A1M7FF25_9BACT|nr:TonB-dependent receptor [Hymenobacter psychrotolerans]SHM02702.1 Outer membrane receptor for ferrienterochelin and colicins [Hymenobacter psychrotolerans DSM 18569]
MTSFTAFSHACKGLGFLAMLAPLAAAAQQPAGTLSGTLLDQSNGQPLPFANVIVLRAQDSTFVSGTQTGENGAFELASLGLGNYLLKASAIGYQGFRRPVALTSANPTLRLGTLKVAPTATQLKGVTVTGERAAVEESLDKKVINVEKDLSSVGGTATNVLQNVPGVAVAPDGTVSMRGSSSITILIDGKPSQSANSGAGGNRLEQIPASAIEKVEVVTNPSARYDAAGSGGVLNIILKKQKKDGWNGQASGTVGTRDKYNASLSLNRRAGKFNWFGSYDLRDHRYISTSRTNQRTTVESNTLRIDQDGNNLRHNANHSARLGFDYTISPEQTLTLTVEPNMNRGLNTGTQLAAISSAQGTDRIGSAFRVKEDVSNTDASLDYRRTWQAHKGRELTASLAYTRLDADVVVGQRNTFGSDDLREWKQDLRVDLNAAAYQADYVHPIGEGARFEAGLKGQMMLNDGTDDFLRHYTEAPGYERLADRSFAYNFKEFQQAGYATYQQKMGQWSAQGGLRAEYTNTSGEVNGGSGPFRLSYLNLFPSATVARTLPTADQRVQLSYSRRLNRPNFMQLLAFPLYQDQRSYRIGDPTLRPEYINSFELGHQMTMKQTSLTSTLFYRQTTNAIQRLTRVDEEATRLYGNGAVVTGSYSDNFGQATSLGAELSLNHPLAKWWRLTASGSLFQTNVTAATGNETSRRTVSGTGRLMNTFNPTPKLDVQLTGNYRAAAITSQGRIAPVGSVEIALRQRLLNDRAALTLRVSDIFNTQRNRTEVYAAENDFQATYYNKWESRVGYLGFSWYLGSTKPPKKIESQPQGGGGGFGG